MPLLVLTVFGAWFVGEYVGAEQIEEEQRAAEAAILDTTRVITGDLRVTVSGTGAITPNRQVPLAFQIPSAPVADITIQAGQTVATGDVIASLLADDLEQNVQDAQLALRLQETSTDALTRPPREVDLAAAEAAIDAARAQLYASYATGATGEDREIARLQTEIARNQLWQSQLQRDAVVAAEPEPVVLLIDDVDIDDRVDDDIEEPLEEGINDTFQQLENQVNAQNDVARVAFNAQVRQANSAVQQVDYGVQIADENLESTLQRGADAGAVAGANAALAQAEIAYDRLRNGATDLQLRQAAINLELAQYRVRQAEIALEQTQLVAPFDGIIAQMNLTEGELPPQGIGVLLIDDSSYFVDLPIDETDIAQVVIGQPVEFDVDALPSTNITGTVESIAYTPLDLGQLVAYNVRVRLDPTTAEIRAGMTVTGNIITTERTEARLIRNNFIRIDRVSGDAFVTVREPNGQRSERLIVLGERNSTFSEVLAGLEVGEEVILLPRTDDNPFDS